MNFYIKLGGFAIIGYLALWIIFMIYMSIRLYIESHGYPDLTYFLKLLN
jgi:hypothetical protein